MNSDGISGLRKQDRFPNYSGWEKLFTYFVLQDEGGEWAKLDIPSDEDEAVWVIIANLLENGSSSFHGVKFRRIIFPSGILWENGHSSDDQDFYLQLSEMFRKK